MGIESKSGRVGPVGARGATIALVLAHALAAALTTGCSDDPAGSNAGSAKAKTYGLPSGVLSTLTSVNTSVDKTEIVAGETVRVACVGDPGAVPIPEPEFDVTPAEGSSRAKDVLTLTRAGTVAIACTLHDGKVKDDSPVEVVVLPAQAVKLIASIEPTKVGAGAKATVSCKGEDAFGNVIGADAEGWSVAVDSAAVGALDGMTVEGRKAGTAKVTCALATASDEAVSEPATLEVVPGSPAKTVASVAPDKIVAGASQGATVACALEDAYGNALPAGEMTVDVPSGLSLSGKTVTGTKAGVHDITCALKGTSVEQVPAKLTVDPAGPVDWSLEPKTISPVYKAGDVVLLQGRGKDEFGNEIKAMKVAAPASYDPVEQVKENKVDGVTKSYSLLTDGNYTFTTSLDGETWGAEVAAKLGPRTLKLKADSTGPMVLITDPKRGETRKGDAKVVVKGMVVDELSAVKSFTIGNQPVTVGPDGSFTWEIQGQWGMNPIVWVAKDEWDNARNGVQSWYYSTLWLPATATPVDNAMVEDGIGIWLSQVVIDSGKHDHAAPKDLATVAEVILKDIDFASLLAGAGGGKNGYMLEINQKSPGFKWTGGAKIANIKMGDKALNGGYPQVTLTVIDGGIHMVAKIYNFSADLVLELESELDPNPVNLKPTKFNQTATMSAKAIEFQLDLMLTLDAKTGKIKSEAKNVDLNLVDFNIQLSGVLGFLTNWLLGATKGLLESAIELLAKTTLNDLIGNQLGSLLENLAINTSFELGPLIGKGEATKINLNSKPGQLIFKPSKAQAGGILLALDAATTAAGKVEHQVLGSIGRAACLQPGGKEVFNPGLKFPIEAGLRDDFVNELLFALWWGGLLQLDIGADALGSVDLKSFGVSDLSVQTDFLLPPILNTCLGNDGIKLQIGDLRMHAVFKLGGTPIDIWLYGTMQATAKIDAVKNKDTGAMEIGFALKSIDFLELEVEKINEEGKDLQEVFLTLIKTVLLPKLTEGLGDGLGSFPLPEIDLSSFSPQIPKGSKLKLAIQQIETVGGYTYARGTLE